MKTIQRRFAIMLLGIMLLFAIVNQAEADRIKDIASIAGIRNNQLLGYGLVVGLDGTGDNNNFTNQSFKTMLMRLGIQLPPDMTASSKNIAAVAVHADLPPFARPGQRIDVTVSSIGNAKSLRGGTLLLTPLKAANGEIYAVAQGNMVVGGFGVQGGDGSQIKVNVPVVGRVSNGATIEVAAPSMLDNSGHITYLLHRPDFTTAKRLSDVINKRLGRGTARAIDPMSVDVCVPIESNARVTFLSMLENLSITPGEAVARIVVNARTGTIVVGKHVMVGPAAVAHGNLVVTITESQKVSQPEAGSPGTTQVTQQSNINVNEANSHMFLLNPGPTLDEVVQAVNEVGAAPGDLMAILEALQRAGALHAEIEVI